MFLIIGAQKSASTSLQHALRGHPEVYLPTGESQIFEDPHYSAEVADRSLSLLRSEAACGRQFTTFGIKRPDYLGLSQVCAPRIARHCPDARLVAILRHPVDRAIAAYFHYVKYDALPLLPAEEALSLILKGSLKEYPLSKRILEYGLYGKHLKTYSRYFDRSQLFVGLHDHMLGGPTQLLTRVSAFLGLSSGVPLSVSGKRSQAVVYSPMRLRFLRLRNPMVFQWVSDGEVWRFRFGALSKLVWYCFEAVDRYGAQPLFGNQKPIISRDLRRALLDYYREDQCILSEFIGGVPDSWEI